MFDFFKRIRRPSKHPFIQYVQAENLTSQNTALLQSPEMLVGLPETLLKGPGDLAGSFAVLQPPQVFQRIALPTSPQQGIPAGTSIYQGLITQDQYEALVNPPSDAAVQ